MTLPSGRRNSKPRPPRSKPAPPPRSRPFGGRGGVGGGRRAGGGDDEKRTRVDGKGLWRSWKRNFTSNQRALLDLVDNSLDAAIPATHGPSDVGEGEAGGVGGGSRGGGGDRHPFVGRVHVFPDVHEVLPGVGSSRASATTTGLCLVNNSAKPIRPLKEALEVYNSSKVDSGAGDIGENGVGLKQGCATLSDRSFVLTKNGSDGRVELGICAEALQREEGCYLPAFRFSNDKEEGSLSLKDQMIHLFSKPKHADVAQCIAQYGAADASNHLCLTTGVERLCQHFDHMCCNFFDNNHVFMVILDKIHHVQSDECIQRNAEEEPQKVTVNKLMRKLGEVLPRTYLHVPDTFDFTVGGKKVEFKYWPARLVELTSFTVNINPKISWQHKFSPDNEIDHPDTYELRVFAGFDGMRVTGRDAKGRPLRREASLYVYSRHSGRLISRDKDARTHLGLTAGGTDFCQGLTIIIDDVGGNLPLNPTKEQVAFGEEAHGDTHKENLMTWVGGVVHFFYMHHLEKFGKRKTDLTRNIANYGDVLLQKHRQLKTLDSSQLTTYHLSFKTMGERIKVDKSNYVEEIVGADTQFRLTVEKRRRPAAKKSPTSAKKRKADDRDSPSLLDCLVPRRNQKVVSYKEADSDAEGEIEESDSDDGSRRENRKSNAGSSEDRNGEAEDGEVEDGEVEEDPPVQDVTSSKAYKEQAEKLAEYKGFVETLTQKTFKLKARNKSLKEDHAKEREAHKEDLARERDARKSMEKQLMALQKTLDTLKRK